MELQRMDSTLYEYIDANGQYHFPGEYADTTPPPTMMDTLKWLWTKALRLVGLA